jgi:hypothetical protein
MGDMRIVVPGSNMLHGWSDIDVETVQVVASNHAVWYVQADGMATSTSRIIDMLLDGFLFIDKTLVSKLSGNGRRA